MSMKLRIWFGVLAFLSSVMVAVGYVLTRSYQYGLCYSNLDTNSYDVVCHQGFFYLGSALTYGMAALAIVFVLLLVFSEAFSWWWKFAIWFIPLDGYFLYNIRPSNETFKLGPSPDQMYLIFSGLYVLISLIIIIVAAWRQHRVVSGAQK